LSIFDGFARLFGYQPMSPRADGDQSTALALLDWFYRWATGGGENVSGIDVNAETSLQLPVVWDCLEKRSDVPSSIPCTLYRHSEGIAKKEARGVPLYRVLAGQFNGDQDSIAGFKFMQLCVDTYGFGVGWKKFNGMGEIVGIEPIHPSMAHIRRTPDPVVGRVVFDITEGGRTRLNTPKDDLFYVPNLTLAADRYTGLSPIAYHKNAIGLGLAAEQFGAAFFGNGARPDGIITFEGVMDPTQKKQKIESWNAQHRTAKKGSKLAVLDQGQKYQAITIPPEHAQFIETRRYGVEDICRIFGVPPALVGGRSESKENIEQLTVNFRVYTMRPMLRRWESAINCQLLTEAQKQFLFAEFVIQELLAADLHAKANFLTAMMGWGVYSPNEVRAEFNLNPVPGLDRHFVPMNMVPIDRLDDILDKGAQAKNPPTSKTSGTDTASDQKKRQEQNAKMQMALEDMIRDRGCRLVRIEADQLCAAAGREGNFLKWMDRYYDQHAAKMVESLRPMLKVVQLHQERTADDHEVEERVRSYVEDSKKYMLNVAGASNSANLKENVGTAVATWEQARTEALCKTIFKPEASCAA
jgi:HK97 family phage portal protein